MMKPISSTGLHDVLASLTQLKIMWLLLQMVGIPVSAFEPTYGRCERITIPMCMDMQYNLTQMPNLVGHSSQKDAAIHVHEFIPLVQFGCSPLLNIFLCSLYAPMCTDQVDGTLVIPACRSMCLRVRAECEPVLLRFEFKWPSILDCERLPERSDMGDLCMQAPEDLSDDQRPPAMHDPDGAVTQNAEWRKLLQHLQGKTTPLPPSAPPISKTCPERFVYVDNYIRNGSCASRCGIDVLFKHSDKQFAEIWMTVWASTCLASTLITLVTFLIDTRRFRYPERPIIFLTFCYAMYSLAYIIRIVIGAEKVSCDHIERVGGIHSYVAQEGLELPWCVVVFLLTYYFSMAAALWWLCLAISWFLAAGRKWGKEAIESLNVYFQVLAWAVPAVKSITILVLRKVDGDELTGLCHVGNQQPASLLYLIIVPLCVYVCVGSLFVLAGFVELLRIRHKLKNETDIQSMRKMDKLMAKIGCFSALFVVPTSAVIGCQFYEYLNMDTWRREAMGNECRIIRSGPNAGQRDCSLESSIPSVSIFMLKIFMSMMVGVTTGMWIWSTKTLASWSSCFARVCGSHEKRQPPAATTLPSAQHRSMANYRKCPPASLAVSSITGL